MLLIKACLTQLYREKFTRHKRFAQDAVTCFLITVRTKTQLNVPLCLEAIVSRAFIC